LLSRRASDPAVLRDTCETPLRTLEDARPMLREAPSADYATYGYGRLVGVLKETGEPIGFSGLKSLPELDETEIGDRFLRPCRGPGFATESARMLMDHGRRNIWLERIVGLVDPDHRASVASSRNSASPAGSGAAIMTLGAHRPGQRRPRSDPENAPRSPTRFRCAARRAGERFPARAGLLVLAHRRRQP
jgi:hypothetical protein